MSFDPCIRPLKIWESIGTPTPKMGVHLGVWRFTPSHFFTLPRAWDVTPGLPFWLATLQALALVVNPRLGLQQGFCAIANSFFHVSNPNTQCLVIRWNHLSLWSFWHSHVPTKLICACHKFVWQCALNSIKSKCDFSKIMKFKVHIVTCKLMI